jgi:hypothetical protein
VALVVPALPSNREIGDAWEFTGIAEVVSIVILLAGVIGGWAVIHGTGVAWKAGVAGAVCVGVGAGVASIP